MTKPITIESRTTLGEPFEAGDLTVTPVAQSLILVAGFRTWQTGVVWNRPAAVLVRRKGEQVRIPIVNYTRLGSVAAAGLGIFVSVLLLRTYSPPGGSDN